MKTAVCLAALILVACGSTSTAPHGYVETCYGGDFSKTLSGKGPLFYGELDIPESEWPHLTEVLRAISDRNHLRFFDDTRVERYVHMIHVSLCSTDGLFMYADRRTFLGDDGKPIVPPGPLSVFVFSYKEPEKWAVFAKTTEAELTAEWPGKLKTNPNVQVTLKNSLL